MYMPLKQDSIYELHAHWKTTKGSSYLNLYSKYFVKYCSFTLPKSVVKGIRTLLDFQREDGWKLLQSPFIKYWGATPCPKILMPLVKSYKKFENYHTGLGMFILRELFVKEHHLNAKSSINSIFFLETTEYFAHTQHKFNEPKRHCMKWTQIPLEYFSNWQRQKTFHLASLVHRTLWHSDTALLHYSIHDCKWKSHAMHKPSE